MLLEVSCSTQTGNTPVVREKKIVRKDTLLIGPGTSKAVTAPSAIKSVPGGILVYDYGVKKLFKLDPAGNALISFGKNGKGPGEFRDVYGLWNFDGNYWVYDFSTAKFVTYNRQGHWVQDHPITFNGFPRSPIKVELVNASHYVIPAGGKHHALLALVNRNTHKVLYLGKALADYAGFNPEAARRAIGHGKIPDSQKNAVMLSSNHTGIFSFQQTTADLEKYNLKGERLWKINLKVPAIADRFDQIFRENRERIRDGKNIIPFFNYALSMSATGDGVAILLNVSKKQPLTVVWIPNNGEYRSVITFPKVKLKRLGLTFALSSEDPFIYFVNAPEGKLIRADWPF